MTTPAWPPRTEQQLRSEISSKLLEESHKLDLKREGLPNRRLRRMSSALAEAASVQDCRARSPSIS